MIRPAQSHSRREPMFNIPAVVVAVMAVLILTHAVRSALSVEADIGLLLDLAFIPAQWTVSFGFADASAVLREIATQGTGQETAAQFALARYVLSRPEPSYWTPLSYAVLHGSWAHVLLNCLWLAAFGTPVARRCGALGFLLLAGVAAVGGAAAHLLAHPLSVTPMIGASAAVSGMMAAAARFVFAGSGFAAHGWLAQPHHGPRQSLPELFRNTRAAVFLAIWFATNLLFGIVATPLGVTDASIAWEAHIGGFLVGLLLFPAVDREQPGRFETPTA